MIYRREKDFYFLVVFFILSADCGSSFHSNTPFFVGKGRVTLVIYGILADVV